MGHSLWRSLRVATTAIALVGWAGVASAANPYKLSFTTTMNEYEVNPAVLLESAVGTVGFGQTWPFTIPPGTSTLTDPFDKTEPMQGLFIMGLSNLVPTGVETTGDEPWHLVLFTNNAFAAAAEGQSFESLFPNTSEATLIADLLEAYAVGSNPTDERLNQAGGDVDAFANFLGDSDGINGPQGSIAFGANQLYSVIAFSTGQIIGTGFTSTEDVAPPTETPEPLSLALLASGLAGLVAVRRRA